MIIDGKVAVLEDGGTVVFMDEKDIEPANLDAEVLMVEFAEDGSVLSKNQMPLQQVFKWGQFEPVEADWEFEEKEE